MGKPTARIARAYFESLTQGVVELTADWKEKAPPRLKLTGGYQIASVRRVPDHQYGATSHFFCTARGDIYFFLRTADWPHVLGQDEPPEVYLSGDFNDWKGRGESEWAVRPASLDGERAWVWTGAAARFLTDQALRFKFVTADGEWFNVPVDAPNAERDGQGNVNLSVDPQRTGQHLFAFSLTAAIDLSDSVELAVVGSEEAAVLVRPGAFFYDLSTKMSLGAQVRGESTVFRLFAPRAKRVVLGVSPVLDDRKATVLHELRPVRSQRGLWEVTLVGDLHGQYYWYHLEGVTNALSLFDSSQRVLDPYAKAAVQHDGPGIVLREDALALPSDRSGYVTPAWQDLVIAEAHVRDLIAHAPLELTAEERLGFRGLTKWVEHPDFYLYHLGVNAVELQPIQQFDLPPEGSYHWGYMTTNWFSPESTYSSDPTKASGVRELQELVAAFHRRGMAVILDVVFNHVGVPGHLMFVDKLYYFEVEADGSLSNWSGCGNDFRSRSAMATRMIIDSCIHLIETYGVDGFRFDLAELIGTAVLKQIETAVKKVKPDVILIAEPWSFRGHIAGELRDTGWASWNDGYRDFLRKYVKQGAPREAFEYFLRGSPWYYAKWPAQTINYTESHDDRTFIDAVTEQTNGNGAHPTRNDRRRNHLMVAVLHMSLGVPMLSAGQDFLRSKQGVNNTYIRGDLNAIDYERVWQFANSHSYTAAWIGFRRSAAGSLLRQYSQPNPGFFAFHWGPHGLTGAVLYNADGSEGRSRLLFVLNPTADDGWIEIPEAWRTASWRQIADHERFMTDATPGMRRPLVQHMIIPALSCFLWSTADADPLPVS